MSHAAGETPDANHQTEGPDRRRAHAGHCQLPGNTRRNPVRREPLEALYFLKNEATQSSEFETIKPESQR